MTERMTVTRHLNASPAQVFAVLADPAQHHHLEPGDWVRDAVDAAPLDHVGQRFGMNMHLDLIGGGYTMVNEVSAFEADRVIAWIPGRLRDGAWAAGGWWWRYDLAPAGDGTDVTLTYDWADVPVGIRADLPPLPPFPPEYLDRSLATLAEHLQG